VSDDIRHGETVSGVKLEHVGDQVLELLAEEAIGLGSGVLLPEEVGLTLGKELVVRVVGVGRVEWRVTRI